MRWFAVAVLTSALLGAFVGVGGAAQVESRTQKCGNGSSVQAVFDIPAARAIWQYLPAMGKSPELEVDTPASVVVYGGPIRVPINVPNRQSLADVNDGICVLLSSGERYIYSDVSRTGFRTP